MTFNEWYEDWTQGQPLREGARSVAEAAWDACELNMRDHVADALEKWGKNLGAAESALGRETEA